MGVTITFIRPPYVTDHLEFTFSPILYTSMAGLLIIYLSNLLILGGWLRFKLTR